MAAPEVRDPSLKFASDSDTTCRGRSTVTHHSRVAQMAMQDEHVPGMTMTQIAKVCTIRMARTIIAAAGTPGGNVTTCPVSPPPIVHLTRDFPHPINL